MPDHPQKVMDEAIKEGFFPDWTLLETPENAERELPGFKFKGPGWYLTVEQTLLIIPTHQGNWFTFCFWTRHNVGDAFGWIVNAPTRDDKRDI